jgi:hypothetical protein
MKYEIEYRDGIFFVRTHGRVELEGVKQYFEDLFGHPQWKEGALLLADHEELKRNWPTGKIYPNVENVVRVLAKYKEKLKGVRIAAVYSYTDEVALDFGLYETIANFLQIPMHRKVFKTTEDALRWLKQAD